MLSMVLEIPGADLKPVKGDRPEPCRGQVLIKVNACGVCRTDLHVVDGELKVPRLPVVPGHEIVGEVVASGAGVDSLQPGQRIGVPWLGQTCRHCSYCADGRENLCDSPVFTGYHRDGGYSEFTVAAADYCFQIPAGYSDYEAAPLLCAGLIGWRCLKLAGPGTNLGIYGFGAAAHIITQVANYQKRQVYAFTRPGDREAMSFARDQGALWAGGSEESPPCLLDCAIIFAPVGSLVPKALAAVRKGGTVVCGGIHMSDIPSFPYEILWGERQIKSVANLTRKDAIEFLEIAPLVPVKTSVCLYPLEAANQALADLRCGRLTGAAVLNTGEGREAK